MFLLILITIKEDIFKFNNSEGHRLACVFCKESMPGKHVFLTEEQTSTLQLWSLVYPVVSVFSCSADIVEGIFISS